MSHHLPPLSTPPTGCASRPAPVRSKRPASHASSSRSWLIPSSQSWTAAKRWDLDSSSNSSSRVSGLPSLASSLSLQPPAPPLLAANPGRRVLCVCALPCAGCRDKQTRWCFDDPGHYEPTSVQILEPPSRRSGILERPGHRASVPRLPSYQTRRALRVVLGPPVVL